MEDYYSEENIQIREQRLKRELKIYLAKILLSNCAGIADLDDIYDIAMGYGDTYDVHPRVRWILTDTAMNDIGEGIFENRGDALMKINTIAMANYFQAEKNIDFYNDDFEIEDEDYDNVVGYEEDEHSYTYPTPVLAGTDIQLA